jgi:sugar lactone lactonase YvrE
MQTTWNQLMSPVRSLTAGTWCALSAVLVLCLCAAAPAAAGAPALPIVVTGPAVQIGIMKFTPPGGSNTGGGWDPGAAPLSGTFVVGANGNVIIGDGYSSNTDAFEITTSGTQTILAVGGGGNSTAAAIDKNGNVYIAYLYNGNVYKIPYDTATGAYAGFTTAPTANCLGGTQDTAACIYAPNLQALTGIASMAFDATGNLVIGTDHNGATKDRIYICSAACQAETDGQGTNAPVLLYSDSNAVGAVAVDPWGNIFFSDGASPGSGSVSNLNEIPLQAGTYAASPVVLESYTNAASYANGISGVAVGTNGTVYFATNTDGIFAIPNSSSGLNLAGTYQVSAVGGKGIAVDTRGNLFQVPYSGTLSQDVIDYIPVNTIWMAATAVGGTAGTANVTVMDNNGACSPTLALQAAEGGKATTEFTATAGACSGGLGTGNGTFSPALGLSSSATAATLTFNPVSAGARTAILTVTDSTSSTTGTAVVTGVGQNGLPNLDPGMWTSITAGLTNPSAVVADSAGNLVIADQGAGKVYQVASGTTTLTSIGSGFTTPAGLAFDAAGNLFISDSTAGTIVEIANTGTSGAFVAGTQTTVLSSSMPIGGAALKAPAGLAVGGGNILYIADSGNKRVVTYDPATGMTGTTPANAAAGLSMPVGVAVDAMNNLYVADATAAEVFTVMNGAVSRLTVSSITQPAGVAVDPSGSVFIADGLTGKVVRVPSIGGAAPDASKANTLETVASGASSLAIDAWGNLYAASGAGKAAYAIQRTTASIDIGTVSNGATNSGTVYLMNAGNVAASLASPFVTNITNSMFTLVGAAMNGCSSGSGPAGASCELLATFAPPVGTASGPQTGTATLNFTTPAGTATVTMSGTATPSSILPQTISGFTPPANMLVGQQVTLTATGGASGQPVTFTIDPSGCATCASINGNVLTALSVTGSKPVVVDANQQGGTANGSQYAAATQVQASIAIASATPAGVPALSMNQQAWLGGFPNGGAFAGDDPAGTSFAVNAKGQVAVGTSYGKSVAFYDPTAKTLSVLGSAWSTQVGGVAMDASGNLYVSGLYSPFVAKIPYAGGTYALTDPSASPAPPNCAGSDTSECLIAALTSNASIGGVASMAFDSHGNLFVASDDKGSNPFAIYECTVACQNTGTPAPVLIYQEPTGSSPSTTGQLYIGSIAVDPWDNVFFTDSNFINQTSTYGNSSSYSNLNYLPVSTGAGYGGGTTGYAAAPTVLQKFQNTTVGSYDDEIDGVAVAANGTVYYAYQYDGIYGVPNTQAGGPDAAHQFAVAGQGAKEITLDAAGNLYYVSYNNGLGGDSLGVIWQGNLTAPTAPVSGTPTTAAANVVDNAFSCSTAATLAFTATDPQFSATQGSGCSGISVSASNGTLSHAIPAASSYPATITFAAAKGGPQSATLSVSDTANGGVGTAMVSGVGQEVAQTILFTAPTTTDYTYTPTLTITLGATGGGSNNPIVFTVDASSTGAGTIAGDVLTVTQAGNIVIDANQVGGLVNNVYYQNAAQVQLTLAVAKAAQSIVFPQPTSPVTFQTGETVSLAATGGATGNPVTFSVDSSSTGAATISSSTVTGGISTAMLTITQAGNIVVNADEAGNLNYAAATREQQTIVVNKASQAIVFLPPTQPIHYIAGGIVVSVSANGGGSNQPIVFAVDAASTLQGTFAASTVSGSTSTAVLTIPAQTATSGVIVVDATQPGDTNYADAAQVQESLTILAPLPTQTITFANPGTQVANTPLTLAATASSGLPVHYTSSTTSVCTVAGSTVTFATVTAASTCTVVAAQPGDNLYWAAAPSVTQSFTVNPAGMVPSMNLSFDLSSLTLSSGTVGVTHLTIGSNNNFTGTVALSCSGLPSGYTCTFNPNPVTVTSGQSATTTLSINGSTTASNDRRDSRPFFPAATLAVALCFLGFRKRDRLQMLILVVVGLVGLGLFSGCGGSSTKSTTQPTTSTVTVTAAAGKTSQTVSFSLIVQ